MKAIFIVLAFGVGLITAGVLVSRVCPEQSQPVGPRGTMPGCSILLAECP